MIFCVFKLFGICFCLVIIFDYFLNRVNGFDILSLNCDFVLFKEKKNKNKNK